MPERCKVNPGVGFKQAAPGGLKVTLRGFLGQPRYARITLQPFSLGRFKFDEQHARPALAERPRVFVDERLILGHVERPGKVAEAVGKSAATVRQIARRAREHVAARWPRVRVSQSERQAVMERFLAALRTGRLQDLMEVMAPDVVLIADGGGLAAAVLAPVAQRRARGPDRGRRRVGRREPRGRGPAGHPMAGLTAARSRPR